MIKTLLAGASALAFATSGALAASSFDFTISGNTNVPTVNVENTSTNGDTMVKFLLTIGDDSFNFDFVNALSVSENSATLNSPDTLNGSARSTFVDIDVMLGMGGTLQFNTDVDPGNGNIVVDYRDILFNNGVAANAIATAFFASGRQASVLLLDGPDMSSYSYSATAPVPVPAAALLFAPAVAGVSALRRRKR
ncbi:MAG: hypothetical protein AAF830_11850 [Pseudomonadota bacterium]